MSQTWISDYAVANGIRIHYTRTGREKPPMVLSHGITDNGLCWTRLAQFLERDYDVIMYDARGHGLSEAPQAGYSYEDMAADLAGLVQALDLDKPILIGHSMGAVTTSTTAAKYPDLVGCAILEDPPWWPAHAQATAEERASMIKDWRDDVEAKKSQSREEVMTLCRADRPTWSEIEYGPWADAKLQMSLNVFQLLSIPLEPWPDVVRRITCPILLLTADPELGAIVTPEIAQKAANIWHHGTVAHIGGAGHSIRREQFEKYAQALKAFLDQV
jgi:pimeloyl-ACP methyl ester carboxylesterase